MKKAILTIGLLASLFLVGCEKQEIQKSDSEPLSEYVDVTLVRSNHSYNMTHIYELVMDGNNDSTYMELYESVVYQSETGLMPNDTINVTIKRGKTLYLSVDNDNTDYKPLYMKVYYDDKLKYSNNCECDYLDKYLTIK